MVLTLKAAFIRGFIIIACFSSVIACVHILLSVTRSATFQLSGSKLFDNYQQKNVNFSNFTEIYNSQLKK